MGDLEGEELLIDVEGATRRGIERASGFLKLCRNHSQRVLVADHNGALGDVDVNGKDPQKGGEAVFLWRRGSRVVRVDSQRVPLLLRRVFPELVVVMVRVVRHSHVLRLRDRAAGRGRGRRALLIRCLLSIGTGFAFECFDDAVVGRTAIVHEGLEARDFDRDATGELLGRLLAALLGLVEVAVPAAAGGVGVGGGRGMAAVGVGVGGRVMVGVDGSVLDTAQPVVPGDVAAVDQDGLVVAVVAYVLEEDAAAERGDLQAGDVDVGVEVAPGVGADGVGDEGGEQAVEVEEEEDGQDAADEQLNKEHPAVVSNVSRGERAGAYQLKPSRGFSGCATIPPAMVAARSGETAVGHHGVAHRQERMVELRCSSAEFISFVRRLM